MSTDKSKVILITGCSSGFGLLLSARLASHGYHVISSMRNLDKKDALLKEVQKRGGKIDMVKLDVTDKESIKTAINEVIRTHKRIDVLVNNAGFGIGGAFEDLTDDEIRRQMEVNFFGVQNVTREVIPIMRQQKNGRIINISSVAGFSASPCFGAYNASKWALEAFSESLQYELKFFGIDVCLIEPGTYPTKIFYDNAQYAKNFNNPQSPYYPMSQYLKNKVMNYVCCCRKDPEQIAILAEKIIESKRPAFRNIPDMEGRMLYSLRRLLPFNLYRAVINRFFLVGVNLPTK